MATSRPTTIKKETRKLQLEVEIKDKKSGRIAKLTHEEKVELEYPVISTTFDVGPRRFPGPKREKVIQINKDNKEYKLILSGEVKKGLFKDSPRCRLESAATDFEIISSKISFPQWRTTGFVIIGIITLLLIGGITAFIFWRKRRKRHHHKVN